MAKQIFEGLKVADFSWAAAGPQVSRELAEHGATVVVIENHRHLSPLRTFAPFKDSKPGIDRSAFYAEYNTNKLCIALDITKPRGKETALKLVKWTDIVAESFSPGTMAELGLDYESCRKVNPGVIYLSTSMQGAYGPHHLFKGVGHHVNAVSGYSATTGWPDSDPTMVFSAYSDFIAPWYSLIAIMGALLKRRKTGKGMFIEQAQMECGVTFLAPHLLNCAVNGRNMGRRGNRDFYMCPHGVYPCRGGDRWVAITVQNEEQWQWFCDIIDNPEWTRDPRFATILARKQNEDELDKLIGEWTKDFTPEQVMTMMQEAGVPAGVVQTPEELLSDPQMKHRKHHRVLKHPVIGDHSYHAPAYVLSETPCEINRAAPTLGQDNDYVYKEILGLTDDDIADMLAEGVITTEYDAPFKSTW
jgi:benzylsuccinate CoA-transferase BbsF subunit